MIQWRLIPVLDIHNEGIKHVWDEGMKIKK